MRRTLWITVTFVVVTGWLVASYLPGLAQGLPNILYPAWSAKLLPILGVASAIGFILIQMWIVWATDQAIVAAGKTAGEFSLRRGPEAIWTALPAVFTVLLVAVVLLADR